MLRALFEEEKNGELIDGRSFHWLSCYTDTGCLQAATSSGQIQWGWLKNEWPLWQRCSSKITFTSTHFPPPLLSCTCWLHSFKFDNRISSKYYSSYLFPLQCHALYKFCHGLNVILREEFVMKTAPLSSRLFLYINLVKIWHNVWAKGPPVLFLLYKPQLSHVKWISEPLSRRISCRISRTAVVSSTPAFQSSVGLS